MRHYALMLLVVALPAGAFTCDQSAINAPLPVRTTLVAPFAPELGGAPLQQGVSSGLLAAARDEALAIDVVLLRLRKDACAMQDAASGDSFAGYQKKTEFDNTPWRYETKPGERFSAEEFDAWMKSRGVRVATGKPAAAATAAPAAVAD